MLKNFTIETLECLIADGNFPHRINALLQYAGQANVSELLILLVTLSPINRINHPSNSFIRIRKEFYEQVSRCNILQKIVDAMRSPGNHLPPASYLSADHYASACTQLFCDFIEKLSLDENSEQILQPLGQSSKLIDTLVSGGLDESRSDMIQNACLKSLCFLIKLSADPEVVVFNALPTGFTLVPTSVPSVLHPLHNRMISYLEAKVPLVLDALIDPAQLKNQNIIKHPGYSVEVPFTWKRILLLEVIVRLVESKSSICSYISADHWQILLRWIIDYAHNSMFHALFYKLLIVVLK